MPADEVDPPVDPWSGQPLPEPGAVRPPVVAGPAGGATRAVRPGDQEFPAEIQRQIRSIIPHPVIVESRWTKVARGFAIVRDALVIAVLVVLIILSGSIVSRLGGDNSTTPGDVPADGVMSCPSAVTDEWGTFCPETPGG